MATCIETKRIKGGIDMSLLTQFYAVTHAERSRGTAEVYLRDAEAFIEFIGGEEKLYGAKSDDVLEIVCSLQVGWNKSGVSNKYIRRRLSGIKSFLRFAQRRCGFSAAAIFEDVRLPRIEEKIPNVLTPEQSIRVVECAKFYGTTIHMLFRIMYECGLRNAEARSLCIQNVDLINEAIIVRRGKGGKDRIVPIVCISEIEAYLLYRRTINPNGDGDFLFLTKRGKKFVEQDVAYYAKAIRVKTGVTFTPHTLRHSYATHLYQNGTDIRDLKELLGHTNIATTALYTHTSCDRLREKVKTLHPYAIVGNKSTESKDAGKENDQATEANTKRGN
ncbi:MAG: tyrosine-type recombinase/integrase [Spirochaetota bacterium]